MKPAGRPLDFCPECMHAIYLDPDEPHMLACILKYAVTVQIGGDPRWHRWRRELTDAAG